MTDRRRDGTFLPGQSPGRPKGARNKLQSSFLHALAEDFERDGPAAIKICRIEDPGRYVQIISSLMPRELDIERGITGDLDDEQLDTLIAQVKAELLAKGTEKPMTPLIEAKLVEKVEPKR
jgi:hypothetical protein